MRRLRETWVVISDGANRERSMERNQSTVPVSVPPWSTHGAM